MDTIHLAPTGWLPAPEGRIALIKASGLLLDHDPSEDIPQIDGDEVFLWKALGAATGRAQPTNWQFTGSCTNGGMFNALLFTQGLELTYLPQPEAFHPAFSLYAYGQSRWLAFHDSSEGEGSEGLAVAQAVAEVGAPAADDMTLSSFLPRPVVVGPATCYSRRDELFWSGSRNHPRDDLFRSAAKKHVAGYVRVRSADEGIAEFRRGRVCTFAGDWGGQSKGVIRGTPPVLMMPRRETWQHQQSSLGYWRHPDLGEIFCVLNQWWVPDRDTEVSTVRTREGQMIDHIVKAGNALPMHGENPVGPPGSYWITKADFDYQCRTGEVCFLKQFQGFRGEPAAWNRV